MKLHFRPRHIKKELIEETNIRSHHGKYYVEIITKDGKQYKSNFFTEKHIAGEFNSLLGNIAAKKTDADEADFFLDRHAEPVRIY